MTKATSESWSKEMSNTLFVLNDAPYGNERAYNALRLAAAVAAGTPRSF